MLEDNFIYGNSRRLFLNTELGCSSACAYCYLPSEGFPIDADTETVHRKSPEKVLEALSKDERFIPGSNGTLLSIGCFSECWDIRNRENTRQLILGLLKFGNSIQLATKRRIKFNDLLPLINADDWKGQLKIYISTATISEWAKWEAKTTRPDQRFRSFEACQTAGITAFLYIKPVIPGITIKDAESYASVMKDFKVDAIVGEKFSSLLSNIVAPISSKLFVSMHDEVDELRKILSAHGTVFKNSTDTLNKE